MPNRKPDLILPEIIKDRFISCVIKMWLAEELFCIHGDQIRKYISTSEVCDVADKFTPLMYIHAVAENSDIPIHKKLCQEFIFDRLIEEELTKDNR